VIHLTGIKEYKKILQLKDVLPAHRGYIKDPNVDGPVEDKSLRSGEVRWIMPNEYPEIFTLMQQYGRKAQISLGIDKILTPEPIQLSTYYPGDFYGWHKDGRVMSCSLLLTDKFTGGRLEFKQPGHPLLREAGKAIFFTNIEHRVKPVLTGVRDSLVVWWR
jgi:hypothetical protein